MTDKNLITDFFIKSLNDLQKILSQIMTFLSLQCLINYVRNEIT